MNLTGSSPTGCEYSGVTNNFWNDSHGDPFTCSACASYILACPNSVNIGLGIDCGSGHGSACNTCENAIASWSGVFTTLTGTFDLPWIVGGGGGDCDCGGGLEPSGPSLTVGIG